MKQMVVDLIITLLTVAPRVGAWIETSIVGQKESIGGKSPPAWGREFETLSCSKCLSIVIVAPPRGGVD